MSYGSWISKWCAFAKIGVKYRFDIFKKNVFYSSASIWMCKWTLQSDVYNEKTLKYRLETITIDHHKAAKVIFKTRPYSSHYAYYFQDPWRHQSYQFSTLSQTPEVQARARGISDAVVWYAMRVLPKSESQSLWQPPGTRSLITDDPIYDGDVDYVIFGDES